MRIVTWNVNGIRAAIRKGIDSFFEKIKADIDIFKNRSLIKKRYNYLESKKIIKDNEIIKEFTDDIFVPKTVFKKSLRIIFDKIVTKLSKSVRKKI